MPTNTEYGTLKKKDGICKGFLELSLPGKLAAFGGILAVVGLAVGLGVGLKGKAKTSPQPKDYDSILQAAVGYSCNDADCTTPDRYICANTCKKDTFSYVHNEEEDNNEAAFEIFQGGCESLKFFFCADSPAFYTHSLNDRKFFHWACPATCNYDPEEPPTQVYTGPGACAGSPSYTIDASNSEECWEHCTANDETIKYSTFDGEQEECYCFSECDFRCLLSKNYTTQFDPTVTLSDCLSSVQISQDTSPGKCEIVLSGGTGANGAYFEADLAIGMGPEDCWDKCKLEPHNYYGGGRNVKVATFFNWQRCWCFRTCNWQCESGESANFTIMKHPDTTIDKDHCTTTTRTATTTTTITATTITTTTTTTTTIIIPSNEYTGPGKCAGTPDNSVSDVSTSKDCWHECKKISQDIKYSSFEAGLSECHCFSECSSFGCPLAKDYTTNFDKAINIESITCDSKQIDVHEGPAYCKYDVNDPNSDLISDVSGYGSDLDCWDACKVNVNDVKYAQLRDWYCYCFKTCDWQCADDDVEYITYYDDPAVDNITNAYDCDE